MKNNDWQQRNFPTLYLIAGNLEVREMWSSFFEKEYEIFVMKSQEIQANLEKQWPDLVLIDSAGDDANDVAICASIRHSLVVPVIILVENHRESHLLELYKAGADDCISKPASPLVVQAKLKAWARYTYSRYVTDLDALEFQGWKLEPATRELHCGTEAPLHLTILEFHLVHLLMTRANKTVYTEFLVDHLWKKNGSGDAIQLKNLVYRLRRKIEPVPESPIYLLTIAGIGYSMHISPNK
jgi:DNA-binding response OmpR family regulator